MMEMAGAFCTPKWPIQTLSREKYGNF